MEGAGLMSYSIGHQGAMQICWLHLWAALIVSISIMSLTRWIHTWMLSCDDVMNFSFQVFKPIVEKFGVNFDCDIKMR